MPTAGILTSIDTNSTTQSAARDLVDMAGIRPGRLRLMSGRAEEVLKRLAPAAYDMVFIDVEPGNLERMIQPSLRLLDSQGLLVIHKTLLKGAVADPVDRSPRTQAARSMLNRIAEQENLERVLIPIGEGLLLLQKPRLMQQQQRLTCSLCCSCVSDRPCAAAVGSEPQCLARVSWSPVASSLLSSITRRPPPSTGSRITMLRPSSVTSRGPSPVRVSGLPYGLFLPLSYKDGSHQVDRIM